MKIKGKAEGSVNDRAAALGHFPTWTKFNVAQRGRTGAPMKLRKPRWEEFIVVFQ
jgi:hypothetical protein